jgi:predicted transglutaminase-like cysteine proteinase
MCPSRRLAAWLLLALPAGAAGAPDAGTGLFGSTELAQADIAAFPQWAAALERHLLDDLVDGDCGEPRFNRCHLTEWLDFLDTLRTQPGDRQLEQVNRYANTRDYIFDIDQYGIEDYWAIPREFLPAGGDCEDFAITKFFSLRWLGWPAERLRIVVVQDTNLRIPHAVLAVEHGGTPLILDNQVEDVLTDTDILHYTPVYSINEQAWWLHLPR